MRTLLLVGGGHTHALYLLNARRFLPEDTRVQLVAPERFVPYSGMLPGLVASHYRFHDCHIDLGQLCRTTETELVFGRVSELDLDNRRAVLNDGRALEFDLISLNTGLEADQHLPGVAEHAINTKPISDFLPHWQETLAHLHQRDRNDPANLCVVGGDAPAVEMALAIRYRFNQDSELKAPVEVHLIHSGGSLLPELPVAAQLRAAQMLREREIRVHPLFQVARIEAHRILTDRHQHLPADHVIWCLRDSVGDWLAQSGLKVNDAGKIQINQHLQSVSHPFVFVVGDIAELNGSPVTLANGSTANQAPTLAANLGRALQNEPLRAFKSKKRPWDLVACGDEHALARRGNWVFESRWAWRWKQHLDRKFMAQFPRV